MKGTGLRPVLPALDDEAADGVHSRSTRARLRAAYPQRPGARCCRSAGSSSCAPIGDGRHEPAGLVGLHHVQLAAPRR